MRKLIVTFIALFMLVSCEKEKHSSIQMKLSPESLIFNNLGGNKTVKFTSNVSWSIIPEASWCTVTPVNGVGDAELTVTVSAYTKERATRIIVRNSTGPGVRELIVEQKKSPVVEP